MSRFACMYVGSRTTTTSGSAPRCRLGGWLSRRRPGHKPGPATENHWALCYGKGSVKNQIINYVSDCQYASTLINVLKE